MIEITSSTELASLQAESLRQSEFYRVRKPLVAEMWANIATVATVALHRKLRLQLEIADEKGTPFRIEELYNTPNPIIKGC